MRRDRDARRLTIARPVAALLRVSRRWPDRPDHGRGRGHADALLAAQGPAPGLRAADGRLAGARRARGGRRAGRRDRLARPRPRLRACPTAPRPSSSPRPTAPAAPCAPPHDLVRESETVVVLSGDHPLITAEIIAALLETHRAAGAAATVMTVELDDPGAYGRIVRDADGDVERIVETKDPDEVDPEDARDPRDQHRHLRLRRPSRWSTALDQLTNDNAAGEYYLGDVLPLLRAQAACASPPTSPPTRT